MKALLAIIDKAIETIRGFFQSSAALKAELQAANTTIANQAQQIADLQAAVQADTIDDAALEAAAKASAEAAAASEAKYNELAADLADVNVKAGELAALITDHPDTPVVTDSFEVQTAQPTGDTGAVGGEGVTGPTSEATVPPVASEPAADAAPVPAAA